MKKLTIAQASQEIGISKEAIHNRIRRGSLDCVIENGIKYVLYDSNNTTKKTTQSTTNQTKIQQVIVQDDKYYKFLEEQNKKLQEKLEHLELETRSLREQKEQMLIAEKLKIEDIYIKKDEQLKSILSAISTNNLLQTPQKDIHDIELVEVEKKEKPITVKRYLKNQKIPKTKHKKS